MLVCRGAAAVDRLQIIDGSRLFPWLNTIGHHGVVFIKSITQTPLLMRLTGLDRADDANGVGGLGFDRFRKRQALDMRAQIGKNVAAGAHRLLDFHVHLVPKHAFGKGDAQTAHAIG